MKIIAIDDDEIVLAVLSEALGAFGMTEFELAESGEIGLSKLERADSQFDCVLLDIQMPGLDGIEVCRRLRSMARYRRTPIIMLTAMSERSYVERAFDAGATDYVTKPFDIMELQTRLRVAEQLNDQIKEMRQSQSSLNALNSQLTEEYKPPLSTPLEISDVRGFLGLTEFRNFITQLSRGSYYASSLVALRVQNVDLLYKRCSASEFTYLIEDVANAISAHMVPGSRSKAFSMIRKSRSTGMNAGSLGWTMNMPIIPIAICTISSACGWYMNVPLFVRSNS